ncbi:MAG: hypothetical protein AAGA30_12405 [Planctomycetota bacterium]
MEAEIDRLLSELLTQYDMVSKRLKSFEEQPSYTSKAEIMLETKETLNRIKSIENQLFPMRDKFTAQGGKLGDRTNAKIDTAKQKISELLPIINQLEKTAIDDREKLAPEIHQGVQALKMQSAYGSNQS